MPDHYYSVIARAVSRLPRNSDEVRHAIYERARTALQQRLRTLRPPLKGVRTLGRGQVQNEARRDYAAYGRRQRSSVRQKRVGGGKEKLWNTPASKALGACENAVFHAHQPHNRRMGRLVYRQKPNSRST